MSNKELAERARNMCTKLRCTSMPIADVIPLLQQLADALDGCICEGNWRAIVAEHDNDIGKTFVAPDGRQYVLFGIVHGGDDYYYGMRSRESQLMRLLSCVGSLTQGHGFTEAHMMTVSNRPVLSPEQVADMAIYAEAMRLVSGEGEHLIINGEALNEFMQRSPKHARYARDLIGKPKDWKARDDYFDQMGWEYADVPPEAT